MKLQTCQFKAHSYLFTSNHIWLNTVGNLLREMRATTVKGNDKDLKNMVRKSTQEASALRIRLSNTVCSSWVFSMASSQSVVKVGSFGGGLLGGGRALQMWLLFNGFSSKVLESRVFVSLQGLSFLFSDKKIVQN